MRFRPRDWSRRQRHKLVKPPIRDHNIVVQQHQVFPARVLQPLVDRRGKPAICGIGDDSHGHGRSVLNAGQVISRAVGRPVIDNDQLPARPGLRISAPMHFRVNSSPFQQGMMTDDSPPTIGVLMVTPVGSAICGPDRVENMPLSVRLIDGDEDRI